MAWGVAVILLFMCVAIPSGLGVAAAGLSCLLLLHSGACTRRVESSVWAPFVLLCGYTALFVCSYTGLVDYPARALLTVFQAPASALCVAEFACVVALAPVGSAARGRRTLRARLLAELAEHVRGSAHALALGSALLFTYAAVFSTHQSQGIVVCGFTGAVGQGQGSAMGTGHSVWWLLLGPACGLDNVEPWVAAPAGALAALMAAARAWAHSRHIRLSIAVPLEELCLSAGGGTPRGQDAAPHAPPTHARGRSRPGCCGVCDWFTRFPALVCGRGLTQSHGRPTRVQGGGAAGGTSPSPARQRLPSYPDGPGLDDMGGQEHSAVRSHVQSRQRGGLLGRHTDGTATRRESGGGSHLHGLLHDTLADEAHATWVTTFQPCVRAVFIILSKPWRTLVAGYKHCITRASWRQRAAVWPSLPAARQAPRFAKSRRSSVMAALEVLSTAFGRKAAGGRGASSGRVGEDGMYVSNDPFDREAPEVAALRGQLKRLWTLVQLGFGQAGERIISRSVGADGAVRDLSSIRGAKVDAIFGFCDIKNFTDITECLQEHVLSFVCDVANIVHRETVAGGGAPNKNIGDAFLLVWKLPRTPMMQPGVRRNSCVVSVGGTGAASEERAGKGASAPPAPPTSDTTWTAHAQSGPAAIHAVVSDAPARQLGPHPSVGGTWYGAQTGVGRGALSTVVASTTTLVSGTQPVATASSKGNNTTTTSGTEGKAVSLPSAASPLLGSSRRSSGDAAAVYGHTTRTSSTPSALAGLGTDRRGSAPFARDGSDTVELPQTVRGGPAVQDAEDRSASSAAPEAGRATSAVRGELGGMRWPGATTGGAAQLVVSGSAYSAALVGGGGDMAFAGGSFAWGSDGGSGVGCNLPLSLSSSQGYTAGHVPPPVRNSGARRSTSNNIILGLIDRRGSSLRDGVPAAVSGGGSTSPLANSWLTASGQTPMAGQHGRSFFHTGGGARALSPPHRASLSGACPDWPAMQQVGGASFLELSPRQGRDGLGTSTDWKANTASLSMSPSARSTPSVDPSALLGGVKRGSMSSIAMPRLSSMPESCGSTSRSEAESDGQPGQGVTVRDSAGGPVQVPALPYFGAGEAEQQGGDDLQAMTAYPRATPRLSRGPAHRSAPDATDWLHKVQDAPLAGSQDSNQGGSSMYCGLSSGGSRGRAGVGVSAYRQWKGVTLLADNALVAFLNVIIKMHAANEPGGTLNRYRQMPAIRNSSLWRESFGSFRVKAGFGLHIGWAVEGAIGSSIKVDASYLSPSVNVSARLESATRFYGVDLLISKDFAQCLSVEAVNLLRRIDRVKLKGVAEPMELYTFDWDASAALTFLRDSSVRQHEEEDEELAMQEVGDSAGSDFSASTSSPVHARSRRSRQLAAPRQDSTSTAGEGGESPPSPHQRTDTEADVATAQHGDEDRVATLPNETGVSLTAALSGNMRDTLDGGIRYKPLPPKGQEALGLGGRAGVPSSGRHADGAPLGSRCPAKGQGAPQNSSRGLHGGAAAAKLGSQSSQTGGAWSVGRGLAGGVSSLVRTLSHGTHQAVEYLRRGIGLADGLADATVAHQVDVECSTCPASAPGCSHGRGALRSVLVEGAGGGRSESPLSAPPPARTPHSVYAERLAKPHEDVYAERLAKAHEDQMVDLEQLQPESEFSQDFVDYAELAMEHYLGDYDSVPPVKASWGLSRHYVLKALELRPDDGPLTTILQIMEEMGELVVLNEDGSRKEQAAPPHSSSAPPAAFAASAGCMSNQQATGHADAAAGSQRSFAAARGKPCATLGTNSTVSATARSLRGSRSKSLDGRLSSTTGRRASSLDRRLAQEGLFIGPGAQTASDTVAPPPLVVTMLPGQSPEASWMRLGQGILVSTAHSSGDSERMQVTRSASITAVPLGAGSRASAAPRPTRGAGEGHRPAAPATPSARSQAAVERGRITTAPCSHAMGSTRSRADTTESALFAQRMMSPLQERRKTGSTAPSSVQKQSQSQQTGGRNGTVAGGSSSSLFGPDVRRVVTSDSHGGGARAREPPPSAAHAAVWTVSKPTTAPVPSGRPSDASSPSPRGGGSRAEGSQTSRTSRTSGCTSTTTTTSRRGGGSDTDRSHRAHTGCTEASSRAQRSPRGRAGSADSSEVRGGESMPVHPDTPPVRKALALLEAPAWWTGYRVLDLK